MPKFKDLTGQKFGRLLVESRADKGPRAWWNCKCDCGAAKIVSSVLLQSGDIVSCGCYKKEHDKIKSLKHGHAPSPTKPQSPEYATWRGMKARCLNPRAPGYERYGGRGIKVCERWIQDFRNFLEDMGPRPVGTELDRIDNDGNYCKENCRWITHSENNRNKADNVFIEFGGQRRCLAEWAEVTGIGWHTLFYRIFKGNWTIADALSTPVSSIKQPQLDNGAGNATASL